jgi:hypothetical protein
MTGSALSIVKKGNGTTTTDSAAQSLTIPARPAAPTGIAGGAGRITGTTTLMQYSANGTSGWLDCTATQTIVTQGAYYVRVKQAGTNFAGTNSAQLTVASAEGTGSVLISFWTNHNDSTLATSAASVTLSRSGALGVPTSAVIQGITGSDYSGYRWTLSGSPIAGTNDTPSYTFDSAGKGNGNYSIGLLVEEDGVPYSTIITITVTN